MEYLKISWTIGVPESMMVSDLLAAIATPFFWLGDIELSNDRFKSWLRWRIAWGRKRAAPGQPAPPLPIAPTHSPTQDFPNSGQPTGEFEFQILKLYHTREEFDVAKRIREAALLRNPEIELLIATTSQHAPSQWLRYRAFFPLLFRTLIAYRWLLSSEIDFMIIFLRGFPNCILFFSSYAFSLRKIEYI